MGLGNIGSDLSAAGGLLGAYNGATSGSPTGEAQAAIGAGKVANQFGAFGDNSPQVGAGLGAAGAALGIYGGLQAGGVAGDTQVGLGAAQLAGYGASYAGATGASAILAGAGPLSIALAPALIGMETPAVQLTPKYWQGMTNSLQQAINSGDKGQIASVVNGLLAQPQSQIPTNIQQLVYQTGLVPSSGWGQGPIAQNSYGSGGAGGAISVGHK